MFQQWERQISSGRTITLVGTPLLIPLCISTASFNIQNGLKEQEHGSTPPALPGFDCTPWLLIESWLHFTYLNITSAMFFSLERDLYTSTGRVPSQRSPCVQQLRTDKPLPCLHFFLPLNIEHGTSHYLSRDGHRLLVLFLYIQMLVKALALLLFLIMVSLSILINLL